MIRLGPRMACTVFVLCLGLTACAAESPPPSTATRTESADDAGERTPLVVFAAGSLIAPFQALETAFEAGHPEIDVRPEYHGSIQVIRHATELGEPIDIVATADASLIPMLMFDTTDPRTGAPFAAWYCRFAGNRLVLAYTDRSQGADSLNANNWPEVISRPGARLGLADPRFDASGYRALMALALNEQRAGEYGQFDDVFGGQFTRSVRIFREEGLTSITVPEILETVPGSRVAVRGGSIQLLALLESGDVDYAFEYESVARQRGLRRLDLPAEVNLGDSSLAEGYARVLVDLDFQRFASVKPRFIGEPIAYGITIPASAPHPQEAEAFIAFLLGPEGRAIMEENYHPLFNLPQSMGTDVPQPLESICPPEAVP